VREIGSEIDWRDEHWKKQKSPKEVIEFGREIDWRDEQRLKH
jgi:hypothetical protein